MFQYLFQIQNIIILSFAVGAFASLIFLRSLKISGIIIFSISIALFAVSTIFNNLFIQFISISVLMVFFLTMIFYWTIFLYYRKQKIIINSITSDHINPLKSSKIKAEIKNFPLSLPGVYYLIKFSIKDKDKTIDTITESFEYETKNTIAFSAMIKRHGGFLLNDFELIIKDVFGLTEKKLKSDFQHSLSVYPNYLDPVEIPFFLDKGGDEIIQSIIRVETTDFYENRKYYPGDDTRRINWNIFARYGELHIREVEKIPPKIGQILMVFAPYSKYIEEYEKISSVFLSTMHYLLKYGFEIKVIYPGSREPVVINQNSEKTFTDVINNSYHKIKGNNLKNIKNVLLFTSFEEFSRLQNEKNLKNSFAAVSFLEKADLNIFKDLKTYFLIREYDSLLSELQYIYINREDQKKREKNLEKQKYLSLKNNINIKLFRVGKGLEKTE